MEKFLKPTFYIDSDSPEVIEYARSSASGAKDDVERAIRLYYAIRDGFKYNPYLFTIDKNQYRASYVLSKGEGFCIQKSILLAAAARVFGIPSRLGFANVINHLSTKKLRDLMKSDLFVFHGYNELYLKGKWLKATPAFNLELCDKFGIHPLEFNGSEDSIFHPFDKSGNKFMKYVHDYGTFHDFPFDLMISELAKHFPHLAGFFKEGDELPAGDFHRDADNENK